MLGYSTRRHGFDQEGRTLVTYREATARHPRARWREVSEKAGKRVEEMRTGRGSSRQKDARNVLEDLIPRDYRSRFDYGVKRRRGMWFPRCPVIREAENRLKASWGKMARITDLPSEGLSDEDLVKGSVVRAQIEDDLKWLKGRYVISVKPVWARNPAAVPGHVFLCVMGLLLLRYLQWEARDRGLSNKQLVERLEGIRLGVVTRGGRPGTGGKPV